MGTFSYALFFFFQQLVDICLEEIPNNTTFLCCILREEERDSQNGVTAVIPNGFLSWERRLYYILYLVSYYGQAFT